MSRSIEAAIFRQCQSELLANLLLGGNRNWVNRIPNSDAINKQPLDRLCGLSDRPNL